MVIMKESVIGIEEGVLVKAHEALYVVYMLEYMLHKW